MSEESPRGFLEPLRLLERVLGKFGRVLKRVCRVLLIRCLGQLEKLVKWLVRQDEELEPQREKLETL